MKIAIYEILSDVHRYKYVKEADDYAESNESYVRVTDIKEVDFEIIDDAFIIPKKVEALRAEKGRISAEFDDKIGRLLAITHEPEKEEEGSFFAVGDDETSPFPETEQEAEPEATEPFLDVGEKIEGHEEGK